MATKRHTFGSCTSGLSARLAKNSEDVASRDLNRAFQRFLVTSPQCDYKALQVAINTDGDWEALCDAYNSHKEAGYPEVD